MIVAVSEKLTAGVRASNEKNFPETECREAAKIVSRQAEYN